MDSQNFLQQLLMITPNQTLNVRDFALAEGGSLLAALAALWLYSVSYGREQMGAGVHRMFLLGGPAITAVLLSIQFSLPLSLGLLGALSIVRFRTPVKDPAEIGFVLLVVAGSIGFATFNPWLVVVLYATAALVVLVEYALLRWVPGQGRGYLIVTLESPDEISKESTITEFIGRSLKHPRLASVSTLEEQPSFHYQFNRASKIDWGHFQAELNNTIAPSKARIFVN